MSNLCYAVAHESSSCRSERCDPRTSPGFSRGVSGCLVRPSDCDPDSIPGRLPAHLFGRAFRVESDDLDPMGASLESTGAGRFARKASSGPTHATDPPPAPTVVRAPEAESGALWAAAGGLGWSHAGLSFAPTLRRGVEGSAGAVLAASSRL